MSDDVEQVSIQEVGLFIDQTSETEAPWVQRRSAQAVGLRAFEEFVELLLELQVKPGDMFAALADALANQAIKVSDMKGKTIFPSQLIASTRVKPSPAHVLDEAADVTLTLRDLLYRLGISETELIAAERDKWDRFKQKEFAVSDRGCLYSKKSHITY